MDEHHCLQFAEESYLTVFPVNNASIYKLCVGPVIDHEFRHHIFKVAVDPLGNGREDPQTWRTGGTL